MVAAAAGCPGKSHALSAQLSQGPPELRAEPPAPSLYPPLPSWFWRHAGPTPEELAARDRMRQAAPEQAASRRSVPPVVRAAVAAAAESASGPSLGMPRKPAPPEARLRAKSKLAVGGKPTGHGRWVKRPLSQLAGGGSFTGGEALNEELATDGGAEEDAEPQSGTALDYGVYLHQQINVVCVLGSFLLYILARFSVAFGRLLDPMGILRRVASGPA